MIGEHGLPGPSGPVGPAGPAGGDSPFRKLVGKAVKHVPAYAVDWKQEMGEMEAEQRAQAALALVRRNVEPLASMSYLVSDYLGKRQPCPG